MAGKKADTVEPEGVPAGGEGAPSPRGFETTEAFMARKGREPGQPVVDGPARPVVETTTGFMRRVGLRRGEIIAGSGHPAAVFARLGDATPGDSGDAG